MNYDAVIFDKDGVLLDSVGNYKWADEMRVKLAKEMGVEISIEDSVKIVKCSSIEELRQISQDVGMDIDTARDIEEEIAKRKIERIDSGKIRLFKDTHQVLEQIDIPKSIVSNAPYEVTRFTVEKFGLGDHFEAVKSPSLDNIHEYVRLKKPSTHMLEDVIEKMDASNPVMVGDSDDDILAAKNAGIDSIFVNTNDGTDLDPTHSVQSLKSILKIVD